MDNKLHRIAITAIIYNDEGKYLITKRSMNEKAFPGKWTVPGGNISTDDYKDMAPTTTAGQWYHVIDTALRREVREETNVEIEKPEYLLDLAFIRPDGIPVIVLSYFAKYKSGEVQMDDDTTDYAWVTVEEAKAYDLIDGIYEEIVDVDKILKSRAAN